MTIRQFIEWTVQTEGVDLDTEILAGEFEREVVGIELMGEGPILLTISEYETGDEQSISFENTPEQLQKLKESAEYNRTGYTEDDEDGITAAGHGEGI